MRRDIEKELIPALRHLGVRFYAYNPVGIDYRDYDDLGESDVYLFRLLVVY